MARSGRQAASRRRPGGDATGTLRWKIYSSSRRRKEKSETVSLFRQRHHGSRRQGLRSSAERENSSARTPRVAGVGFHSHHVSISAQSSDQRRPAMGLVIPDRTTRFASHRELSAI